LVIQILSAFATGGVVVYSQHYGAGNIDKAEEVCGQLQTIMFETMLAVLLLLSIGTRSILRLLFGSVQDSVMAYAVTYLVVTAFSYPFLAIYNAGAPIFRSIGNSKISMDISLIMNLCNILGNACFVFLFHWGVFGIALSTALSRAVGCGMMQYCVSRPDHELQQRPFPFE
jgi:Na+-driven multidrug efflux pump